ncbi:Na(+)/H(+) antiporter subunit G [Planctomycetes bacterium Pla163]|uniref:Na(+)/H(+) antiporter subunit G n=1 Tax=Rohdeia mirabilis TaxID=2528008 RepID=A0A518CW45_9BACT|nr:Na(+)/H(+) antiporter subunit G [Planctomycetes bacterium Pla163]
MMTSEILSVTLMVVGAVLVLLAGIGLLRFQDVYMRMSATSKAGTLGVMLIVMGSATHFGDTEVLARATATVVFFFVTAPVAAHMLGRASYLGGAPRWSGTWVDERATAEEPAAPEATEKPVAGAHSGRRAA